MKNVFLAAALMLALATNAATVNALNHNNAITLRQEKEYKKIEQSQIPADVIKPAVTKYQGYSLVEALVAEDNSEYKLVLTKDGKDVTAFYKSNGEFIKEVTA